MDENTKKRLYYYWLSTTKGIGLKKINNILKFFNNNVIDAWQGKQFDFIKIKGLTQIIIDDLFKRKDINKLSEEVNKYISKGIEIICIEDEEYPQNLKNIYDPPYILYKKGYFKKCKKYIAVVGSRECTYYGRQIARRISEVLCEYDIGIISGLARGIDTEAHLGAINTGGFTCAVIGCGCDIVYPPENRNIMNKIENTGVIISEYTPKTQPYKNNFPARNRIISGISDGVLIIEAGEKSGALITANQALEQGREVFSIPGNITSKLSKGTNLLIKDGAKIVTCIDDILEELNINSYDKNKIDYNSMSTIEREIINAINDKPIYIDNLVNVLDIKLNDIYTLITSLELKGIIKTLPGKFVVKVMNI